MAKYIPRVRDIDLDDLDRDLPDDTDLPDDPDVEVNAGGIVRRPVLRTVVQNPESTSDRTLRRSHLRLDDAWSPGDPENRAVRKLLRWFEHTGMSVALFARFVGTSAATVHKWCKGKVPEQIPMRKRICEATGKWVHPDDWYFVDGPKG